MNLLQFLPFYQIITEREKEREGRKREGRREGRTRWLGRKRENLVVISLSRSFSGFRISMAGSEAKILCSKSDFGDECACKMY